MLRIYLPIAFATLFILWVLFRLIVKRDLKKHLNTLSKLRRRWIGQMN